MKKPIQLDAFEAAKEAEKGLQRAVDHADRKNNNAWLDKAYAFFIEWLYKHPRSITFMIEEVRVAAAKRAIPEPPSNRSWGGISKRATKDKLIEIIGTGPTKNVKAHRANAAIYKKL